MTDHDKTVLLELAKQIKLAYPFPKVNTLEAGQVLHDVSALLIKIGNHINKKIEEDEQSNQGQDNQVAADANRNGQERNVE